MVVVVVPGFVVVKMISNQIGAKAFLREARTQVAKGKPSLAVSYLNRYLELSPDDVDAMEMKSKILFDTARDEYQAKEAIKVHVQMIAVKPKDPRWEKARRRMVRLNLMVGRWESALSAAEKLEGDDAEAHLLKARALAAVGVAQKDKAAIETARQEYEAAEAKAPGDVESAEELARIYRERRDDTAKALQVLDAVVVNTGNDRTKHAAALLARARHYATAQVIEKDPEAVEKASRDVDDAVRDDPEGVMPRLIAAEVALQRRQTELAREHLAAIPAARRKDVRDDIRIKNLEGMIDLSECPPRGGHQGLAGGPPGDRRQRRGADLAARAHPAGDRPGLGRGAAAGPVPPAGRRRRPRPAIPLPGRPLDAPVEPPVGGGQAGRGDPLQGPWARSNRTSSTPSGRPTRRCATRPGRWTTTSRRPTARGSGPRRGRRSPGSRRCRTRRRRRRPSSAA